MATKTELKGARELLDLDVREVSLVDRPANLREFLVVKRLEDPMGLYESDYSTGGVDPSQVAPVFVRKNDAKPDNGSGDPAVEVAKQTTDGGDPVDVETITKAVEGETVDMTKARHAYEVAALKSGKGDEVEEALTKRQEAELEKAEELAKAAKAKADGDKAKAGDDEDGKGKKPAFPGAKPFGKKTETTKSADGGNGAADSADDGEGDQMVVVKRDGSVHVNGELVQKASTEPTTLRTAAVSAAVTALAKQLGELSDEELAKALEGINKGKMPTSPKFRSGTTAQGTKTTKAPVHKVDNGDGGDEENPIVAAVQAALEPITKRLEEIEKTRTPSKSADGDGGTDTQQPVAKSFWDGVL